MLTAARVGCLFPDRREVLVDGGSIGENGFFLLFDPEAEGLAGQTWSDSLVFLQAAFNHPQQMHLMETLVVRLAAKVIQTLFSPPQALVQVLMTSK